MPEFIKHCVTLSDGETTLPGKTPISETKRFESLLKTFGLLLPEVRPEDIRIADLGCYEGGYSLELARSGYQVTGIEGREENLEKCCYLQDRESLQNLTFIKDDVSNILAYGKFDVVYASGILYHMYDPIAFLDILAQATDKALIISTHYAEEDRIPSRFRHKLSGLTRNQGYQGRWYEEQTDLPRASIENKKSYWLTRDALFSALLKAGFSTILEQYDCHYDMQKALQAIRRNSRSQFIAVK